MNSFDDLLRGIGDGNDADIKDLQKGFSISELPR